MNPNISSGLGVSPHKLRIIVLGAHSKAIIAINKTAHDTGFETREIRTAHH